MANICNNEGQLEFLDNVPTPQKVQVLKKFKEEFDENKDIEYILSEDADEIEEETKHFSIGFESRWSVPSDELSKFAKENNVTFRGASTEQGCGYYACWEISPLEARIYSV